MYSARKEHFIFKRKKSRLVFEEEEEEHYDLWSGTQMWRRDLRVRDKVLIRTYEHVLLNNMGWGGRRSIGSEHLYAQIECEVVRVAIEPHEASEGLAPFLLKPLDGRNRLQIQAYQPKQSDTILFSFKTAFTKSATNISFFKAL